MWDLILVYLWTLLPKLILLSQVGTVFSFMALVFVLMSIPPYRSDDYDKYSKSLNQALWCWIAFVVLLLITPTQADVLTIQQAVNNGN